MGNVDVHKRARQEARSRRLSTALSRREGLVALVTVTAAGLFISLVTDQIVEPQTARWFTLVVSGLVALVAALAIRKMERESQDFALCIVAWGADTQVRGRDLIHAALDEESRSWEPYEVTLPESGDNAASWLRARASHVASAIGRGMAEPVGEPRIVIVPATKDACAFAWGWSLRPSLMGCTVDVWGRFVTTDRAGQDEWRHLFDLDPQAHAKLFLRPDPQVEPCVAGIHLGSPRRLPPAFRDEDGEPDIDAFTAHHEAMGFAVVTLAAEHQPGTIDADLINAASRVRAHARRYVARTGMQPVPLRLNLGEAESFALGLLLSGFCDFSIEVWRDGSWRQWLRTDQL